jgi:uncharacterized membrane protein YccC
MLVATLLSGHEILTISAIVVAVFLAFQANVAAYGAMVFWLTVILGLLFGMLGFFAPELLLLRLKEAAVGAACGAVVASLVLVRRERVAVDDAARAFLLALGQSVDSAAHGLLDGRPAPDTAARILAAEQRFRDLGAIAQSERLALAGAHNEALRRRMLILEGCELWARELGQICLQSARLEDPALVRLVSESVARIDAGVLRLIDRMTNQPHDEPPEVPEQSLGDDLPRAVRLLLRIDSALAHMVLRKDTQR